MLVFIRPILEFLMRFTVASEQASWVRLTPTPLRFQGKPSGCSTSNILALLGPLKRHTIIKSGIKSGVSISRLRCILKDKHIHHLYCAAQ